MHQKALQRKDDDDSDDGTDWTRNDEVGHIVLDRSFWASVIDVLKVTAPTMQLLFADDNKGPEVDRGKSSIKYLR